MTLAGCVVVITGAGGGIAAAVAMVLAGQGAHLALVGRGCAAVDEVHGLLVAADASPERLHLVSR